MFSHPYFAAFFMMADPLFDRQAGVLVARLRFVELPLADLPWLSFALLTLFTSSFDLILAW
ncbi:MAG: hypothetical protein ACI8WB_005763 [Phenylobacterium sp.]|jgi:hypothetical protein